MKDKDRDHGFVKKFLKELKKGNKKGYINDEGFNLLKEDSEALLQG